MEIFYLFDLVVHHPIASVTPNAKRFNYAFATAALLIKHMLLDKKHLLVYFGIYSEMLLKSFLRTLQSFFLPKSRKAINLIFRPRYVLTGSLLGSYVYFVKRIKLWNV